MVLSCEILQCVFVNVPHANAVLKRSLNCSKALTVLTRNTLDVIFVQVLSHHGHVTNLHTHCVLFYSS